MNTLQKLVLGTICTDPIDDFMHFSGRFPNIMNDCHVGKTLRLNGRCISKSLRLNNYKVYAHILLVIP